MAILVVCPGCKKSFNVDDKFAGKTGPCPKCKTKITIPEKQAEVTIHAPDEFGGGGKSVSGKLLLKPIARQETKLKPLTIALIAGGVVGAVAWALAVRFIKPASGEHLSKLCLYLAGIGTLLVSPPLAAAGYAFLRDDEREPVRGKELYIRAAVCGLVYMVLWAVFIYVKGALTTGGAPIELPSWLMVAPPFLLLGAAAGKFSFDLETSNGFFHYAFYLAVTMLLGVIAGFGWAWQ